MHELLQSLEENDNDDHTEVSLAIMPPLNYAEPVTDEDSGDENIVDINNLPGSQLRAEAEFFKTSTNNKNQVQTLTIMECTNSDSEDDLPLSEIRTRIKKTESPTNIKKKYKWSSEDLIVSDISFPASQNVQNCNLPSELFSFFWNDDVIEMFVTYSNLYALSKNKAGNITKEEMKNFFGIFLLSGYMPVPRRRMFWENSSDSHNDLVCDALSRDRFEYIFSNLHCCDNANLDLSDKFTKVRPLFRKMNKAFRAFAPLRENHSVDEAMVPYYGHHGCKQFIRGKPIRYGFKLWTGTTSGGYVIWFEPYQGAKSEIDPKYKELGLGPSVVLQYADVISSIQEHPYHIFCDNFFTNIPLCIEIKRRNMRITGTIRENRTSKCPLISTSDLKKRKRGDFDFKSNEDGILVVKWHDNSVVSLASNSIPVYPTHSVGRYSLKEKKRIKVEQPHNIFAYNRNMGGVDRADQNVSLYRVALRGKKWYMPLIFHMLDLAEHNAWQLHRTQNGTMDHLTFRRRVAMSILEGNQRKFSKRSRPSSLENADSRYDRIDHLIIQQEKQTRCRLCHKKVSTKCEKCNVALHVICFKPYHVRE